MIELIDYDYFYDYGNGNGNGNILLPTVLKS